jgi:cellulose synthase (UDP-forming)
MLPPSTPPSSSDYLKEIRLTRLFIAFTLIVWLAATWEIGLIFIDRVLAGNIAGSIEQAIFILIVQGLIYGNFLYQLTRLGYLCRRLEHLPASPQERERTYADEAPALAILVPSYKEELATIERTLLSAALQDYPRRRVVLLLDDHPSKGDLKAHRALDAARGLPIRLQATFNMAAKPFTDACAAFSSRLEQGSIDKAAESANIARLYVQAAGWLESYAARHAVSDHCDDLLIDQVLLRAARAHRVRARTAAQQSPLELEQIQLEYKHLATLFHVELSSFERKRYVNLSHEPNKAMNLNSYIGLLGRSWLGMKRPDGLHLEPVPAGPDTFDVPAADFLITLDADSMLVPEYASILVHHIRRPGNERIAVVQTPYNTVPAATGLLERIAGATTDIQYLVHQGFTHYDATYWVGANALLRMTALHDIKHCVQERGFEVTAFIQDRTVIEDTESTVDLVACGWRLYNYPERLAYSATPPDFGSLLIQRCRWANGGLIILPKLVRYLISRPFRLGKVTEGFFRLHYLGSIAAVNLGLLVLLGHSFETSTQSISLLILTSVPYFVLYARDLRYSGYRTSDLIRVYALNLLLLPVNLAGVFKSLQQAITGRRIPFARTPKVSGRITVPVQFVLAEYALLVSWLAGFGIDLDGGRWISAAFCLANALLLAYAIGRFVGWRASWEDLRLNSPWPAKATNRLATLKVENESANDPVIVHFERKEHRQDMPEHALSLDRRDAVRERKR